MIIRYLQRIMIFIWEWQSTAMGMLCHGKLWVSPKPGKEMILKEKRMKFP
jgi:hypothetical protein